jgi:hypothetical protein
MNSKRRYASSVLRRLSSFWWEGFHNRGSPPNINTGVTTTLLLLTAPEVLYDCVTARCVLIRNADTALTLLTLIVQAQAVAAGSMAVSLLWLLCVVRQSSLR